MEKQAKTNSYRFIRPLINLHLGDTSAYLLLVFLCHAANNKTGESWHSHTSIMYTTGMAEKTIRKATKTLVELGVISCEIRGWQKSKLYTVHYDKLLALAKTSQAGRDQYILAEQGRKAARQQRWREPERDGQKGVSQDQTETVRTSERDGQNIPSETVKTSSVRQSKERPNCVRELSKGTKEKELEQKQISGNQDSYSKEDTQVAAAEDIQQLEREVSELKSLKDKAISERRPEEYKRISSLYQERQMKLNYARGSLIRAALAGTTGQPTTAR